MMTPENFQTELSWITDPVIREFTTFCLSKAPPYFWENPSSSTGKYHAPWSNVRGGLVLHSKATAYMAKELARAYELSPIETDAAISAAILHDIAKYGIPGSKHTASDHDRQGANFIVALAKQFGKPVPLLRETCSAIALHYGVWTKRPAGTPIKKFPEEYSRIEQLIHIADMTVSRPEVEFTFTKPTSLVG